MYLYCENESEKLKIRKWVAEKEAAGCEAGVVAATWVIAAAEVIERASVALEEKQKTQRILGKPAYNIIVAQKVSVAQQAAGAGGLRRSGGANQRGFVLIVRVRYSKQTSYFWNLFWATLNFSSFFLFFLNLDETV